MIKQFTSDFRSWMCRESLRISIIAPLVFSALVLGSCSSQREEKNEDSSAVSVDFLSAHWERPLKPQGAPPEHWSEREKSLFPSDCGECHKQQYDDWSTAFHSRAMGPGLLGQLVEMDPENRSGQYACIFCHTPSAEQADGVQEFIRAVQADSAVPDLSDSARMPLFAHGMICINCHYREFKVYGPERREEAGGHIPDEIRERLPHGGWEIRDEYLDSRFCAACHQFPEDGGGFNGKLFENTYNEWKASDFARKGASGKTCQQCHMPERRHLWRGIHDSAMVRNGLEIRSRIVNVSEDEVAGVIVVKSVNVGHNFPTYVTPKVYLESYQVDSDTAMLVETFASDTIGWHMSLNLDVEYFDTRIAPGDSAVFHYRSPRDPEAAGLTFGIRVEPDAFYTSFYEAKLSGGFTKYGTEFILRALAESQESEFTIFKEYRWFE